MKKEVGSEFYYNIEDIIDYIQRQDENNFFNTIGVDKNKSILLDSGRSCIKYLLKNILNDKVDKVLLPSFLCNSIVNAVESENVEVEFYNVNSELVIDINDLESKVKSNKDIIYFINYFGFYQPKAVYEYLEKLNKTNIIIEDCTHTIFSNSKEIKSKYIGDFQIASIRKWLGIPDGAILFSRTQEIKYNEKFLKSGNNDFSVMKLLGQLLKSNYIEDGNCKKEYFMEIMKKAVLTNEINTISSISNLILNGYNYAELKHKRKENYNYLYNKLNDNKYITTFFYYIENDICPLGLPVKVKVDRDKFRKYLSDNKIYCPVHWNSCSNINIEYTDSKKLSEIILTIPCDQRYSKEDMKYIVEKINLYNEK